MRLKFDKQETKNIILSYKNENVKKYIQLKLCTLSGYLRQSHMV